MEDANLVSYNKLSPTSFDHYYDAIDKAFKFNVAKRDEYLIREAAKNYGLKPAVRGTPRLNNPKSQELDEMQQFFARHKVTSDGRSARRDSYDRYHWARDPLIEDRGDARVPDHFLLPRLKC